MLKYFAVTITMLLLLACVSGIHAESLWQEDTKPMYADKKAYRVGDIVTIIIVESATSSSTASTNAKKDSKTEIEQGIGPLVKNIPGISYSGGDEMKASGTTSRTSKFVARMTATVTKVDANGNLDIEGTRVVQTNREEEQIKLTGTIRPQDIGTDNTVLSSCLANAKIAHEGKGPIGSRQREGLITKILKMLF